MSLSTFLSAAVKNPDGTYNIPKSVDRANKMLGTVLTIAEPIDGVWQFALTRDGEELTDWCVDDCMVSLTVALDILVEDNSDAAAAADDAVDAIHVEYELDVTTIVYPDGQTVVC